MLKAASAVKALKEYHPPLGDRCGLRLDFNENTIGCSPRVLARLRQISAEDITRYPERAPVEAVIAGSLGLEPAQILLTNGVDEGIHLLAETFLEPGCEALIPVPTFSMYEIYAAATGARVVLVPPETDFRFPLEGILERISPATRLIALANPNNPTGAVASRQDLLAITEAAAQAAVLVDEAYFDFYGSTVIDEVGQVPNLFVARTFSKAFGMAGLRAGILAGDSTQMAFMRRVASPYNINTVALACLPEAIADVAYVAEYVAAVQRNRSRLQAELECLGLAYRPSQANFVLTRLGAGRQRFVALMRVRGILVRDRHSDAGCDGCVRISVGTDEQTTEVIAALRAVVAELRDGMAVSA